MAIPGCKGGRELSLTLRMAAIQDSTTEEGQVTDIETIHSLFVPDCSIGVFVLEKLKDGVLPVVTAPEFSL